ncbi:MAG: hypothetical protein GXO86_05055 [Chlorobi bacterium]|nr:hypothetical protein [Chlorobiota bacterium]
MKRILQTGIFLFFLLLFFQAGAQSWTKNLPEEKLKNNEEFTFYEIQKAFNDYWAPFKVKDGYYVENGIRKKAPGWKQFRRWEWYWEIRVDPITGEFPDVSAADIRRQLNQQSGVRNATGNWKSMGPSSSPGGYAGLGRLNCVAFSDSNSSVIYTGSPSGGLWKTFDGGTTWTALTDDNDVLGVSDVVVISASSTDDDTLYIATGDRDGGSLWGLGGGQSNDNNTIGVLKSVDGGANWSATALTWLTSDKKTLNRLLIHPADNDSIYAAGTDGVFLTTDGGTTWPLLSGAHEFVDMEFKPMNPDIIYGSTRSGEVYKSSDKGTTWTSKLSVTTGYRVELAVSANKPAWVYAVVCESDGSLEGIYKSTDSGETWTKVFDGTPSGSNLLGYYCDGSGSTTAGQGNYDLCIAADPNDATVVFLGGVNTWKSTDGGSTWTISNMWTSSSTYNSCGAPVAHADKHFLAYQSVTGDLFECNDGGLYKTADGGTTWTYLGSGLITSQLYRLGVSQLTSDNVIAGLQDNGTKSLLSGTWTDVIGGDGMECIIDYTDDNTQYGELYYAGMRRTTDGWVTSTSITSGLTGYAAWVTPYVIDPNTHTTLFVGLDEIWKSTNQGTSWTKITAFGTGPTTFRSLAVAPSSSDTIYAATLSTIYASYDAGVTWTDITGTLPVGSSNITYISVNSDFADTLWVAMGEYNAYGVYQSNDAGSTWTDISTGLPSIPVMCVIQNKQNTSEIELYAATDVGVYVKVGSADWALYSAGLPNVVVSELEIYYNTGSPNLSRIRAATFGRGVWESELYAPATSPPTSDFTADNTTPVVDETVTFTDLTINDPTSWFWTFTPATVTYLNGTSSTSQNPVVSFNAAGTYDVELYTENANGSDTETKTGYITVSSGSPTYCSAIGGSGYGKITRVQMGSIDNTSGWTTGYDDYTSLSTNVAVLGSPSLTVTNGTSDVDIDLGVWIDWNQDGDFYDTDEQVVCDPDGGGAGTFTISVPAHAKLGSTRMRLRTKYWNSDCGSPCGSTSNGEVEDYTVNVVAGTNTWAGTTSTDWATASNWSTGTVPTGSFNVTIPTSPTGGVFPEITSSTTDATCNGLTIETGASLTINGNLTVDSALTNNAGVTGLIIGSTSTYEGSLISPTDDVDATVKRYLAGGKWHLIAAPVKSATANSLFFNHDPEVWLKEFIESADTNGGWSATITDLTTPMPLGKGFATWLETGKTGTASFKGKLNALDLSPTLSFTDASHGYNLVGNPFPCAIDWDQGGWTRTNLDGSVWVYKGGSGYLTRNSHGLGSLTDGIIPASQGFFVRATASGAALTIPALARVHSSQLFYKATKQEASDEQAPYVVFNVSDEENSDEVWIAFCEECTEDYDTGWDVTKFFGSAGEPQLYVRQENQKLLSVDALPMLTGDEKTVALNFEAGKTGNHLLVLKEVYDLEETEILLEDLVEDQLQDMIANPEYAFYAVKNHPPDRFLIHFNPNITSVGEEKTENNIAIYSFGKTIYIITKGLTEPAYVSVVDLYGRELINKQLSSSAVNTIPVRLNNSYLVVKVFSRSKVTVKKVFIR